MHLFMEQFVENLVELIEWEIGIFKGVREE